MLYKHCWNPLSLTFQNFFPEVYIEINKTSRHFLAAKK